MERSWIAVGISGVALGCSVVSLVITLRQSPSVTPESSDRVSTDRSSAQSQDQTFDDPLSLTRARPDETSAEIQVDVEAATPDPVEAFQAQLIRNEEILRQLREGELARSQDQ